jgi:hypothetical protein
LFDDVAQLNVSGGVFGIQLTLVDGDTDSDLGAYLFRQGDITVDDDGPAVGEVGTVDLADLELLTGDGGLGGGNDTALGETDAVAGVDVKQAFEDAVTANYGADGAGDVEASNFKFTVVGLTAGGTTGLDTGLLLSSDGTTSVYAYLSADGLTLTGRDSADGSGDVVFTITIDPDSGSITQTQSVALEHSDSTDGTGESDLEGVYSGDRVDLGDLDLQISATVRTTDADGDYVDQTFNSADISSQFIFGDDGPGDFSPTSATLENDGSGDSGDVSLGTLSPGADGGSVRFASEIDNGYFSGLTSNGIDILYDLNPDGTILYAYLDGSTYADSPVFLVTLNQGTYSVQSFAVVDSTLDIQFNPDNYVVDGGNKPWVAILNKPGVNDVDLLLTPGGGSTVNTSDFTAGVGGGQNISVGQFLRLDFVQSLSGDPAGSGGYPDVANQDHDFDNHVSQKAVTVNIYIANNKSTSVRLVAKFDADGNAAVGDGTAVNIDKAFYSYNGNSVTVFDGGTWYLNDILQGSTLVVDGSGNYVIPNALGLGLQPLSITGVRVPLSFNFSGNDVVINGIYSTGIDPSVGAGVATSFNSLEVAYNSGENFKVTGYGSVALIPGVVAESLPVLLVDGDGDYVTSSLDITFNPPAPVAIDLGRDGFISYVSADDGVLLDYGSGLLLSAWVSSSDGLLAYDFNSDGQVTDAKEFVFTMWGNNPDVDTDMQALAAYFDSNKDGVFDSQDDAWDSFGVWQDLNVDGIQQEGEYASLADWGIESIVLSYDDGSTAYTAAGGDVQVYGQMTVNYDDGTTGLAEDMAFTVQAADTSYPVDQLVASYLDTMAISGDTDCSGDLSVAELAYGLDHMVSSYVDSYGLSIEDHAVIQQEVYNQLAHDLNDLSVDDGIDIAFDAAGDANGADVLAALDDHFMEIHDAHVVPVDSYDDPGSMV